jgi:hypothetical protein
MFWGGNPLCLLSDKLDHDNFQRKRATYNFGIGLQQKNIKINLLVDINAFGTLK